VDINWGILEASKGVRWGKARKPLFYTGTAVERPLQILQLQMIHLDFCYMQW